MADANFLIIPDNTAIYFKYGSTGEISRKYSCFLYSCIPPPSPEIVKTCTM